MKNAIRNFLREEDGVTALEYGLLAAVIAGALLFVAKDAIHNFFTELFKELNKAATDAMAKSSTPTPP